MIQDHQEIALCKIDDIVEYSICPARNYLSRNSGKKPARLLVKERSKLALNDLTLRSLNQNYIDEKHINRVVAKVFEDLDYNNLSIDMAALTTMYTDFSNMLSNLELKLTGSIMPMEMSYGGIIIKSYIDIAIKDEKRGYIYPTLIDMSKTRYEVMYNPIAYRCHTAAKEMIIRGSNTEVQVLGISSGKRWTYQHKKYDDILEASITELAQTMLDDRWPVRFGWWCVGCPWKGICFRLL